jgi:glycine cleavage system H protein
VAKIIQERTIKYGDIWIKIDNEHPNIITVGLRDEVIKDLGGIEFLRVLPKGRCVNKDRPFGSIEIGRRIRFLRSPVSGNIEEVNNEAIDKPQMVIEDPEIKGWLVRIKAKNEEEVESLLRGVSR